VSFDLLLKRYFVFVLLGLVAFVALFQASGTMQLIGAAMTTKATASSFSISPVKGMAPVSTGTKSAEPILARNAFDSVTGPIRPKPIAQQEAAPEKPDLSDPLAVPACEGVKALIITESTDPVWSLAALQGPGETAPKLRRLGDDVAGKRVAYIGYNPRHQSPSVWLESGSTLCQTMLFASAVPAATAAAAAASAAPIPTDSAVRRGPPKVSSEIASKIQKVSDSEFHVDRAVVEKILTDQAELMKSARVVPDTQDGKVVGVRLFGIRPDTLLGVLGMQNGDRLETINGFDMASPEKALEAYMRLRTADGLKVQLNRRGTPMTIDYKIK
jgi:general secretion pathway protein C